MEYECAFCTAPCDNEDYCDGCGVFVCDSCQEIPLEDLEYHHQPEDHLREGE